MGESMSKESKERIKQKKKEQAKALMEEVNKQFEEPKEDALPNQNTHLENTKKGIEVLEIYPAKKHKAKWAAQGTLTIKMHDMGLEVRNILYSIHPTHQVNVQPPFRYYRFPDEPEKKDAYVESIKFEDKSIWKNTCKVIREAVLQHHQEDLPKLEEAQQN